MYLKEFENVGRVCLDYKSKNRIRQQDHDRRSLQKNKRNQTKNRKKWVFPIGDEKINVGDLFAAFDKVR